MAKVDSQSETDIVIIEDIANGIEPVPIKVINNFNDAHPFSFEYGTEHRLSDEIKQFLSQPTISDGCDCVSEFDPDSCRCQSSSNVKFNSDLRRVSIRKGTQTPQSNDYRYIECGQHCGCRGKCVRQLSRDRILKKMEIRYKPIIGFTVTSCQHIAPGMPILNYVGMIHTQEGMKENVDPVWGTDYTFNLYEGDYVVHCDAANYGNISRFISHSCYPNAYILKSYSCVRSETAKLILPKLVIVASRSIVPGDEVTIDYGIDYFRERQLPCLCYAYNCGAPPDDYKDNCKTLDETNFDRAESRLKVLANMDDCGDL